MIAATAGFAAVEPRTTQSGHRTLTQEEGSFLYWIRLGSAGSPRPGFGHPGGHPAFGARGNPASARRLAGRLRAWRRRRANVRWAAALVVAAALALPAATLGAASDPVPVVGAAPAPVLGAKAFAGRPTAKFFAG